MAPLLPLRVALHSLQVTILFLLGNIHLLKDHATAIGFATMAVGASSFAAGEGSAAESSHSIAMGNFAQASNSGVIALGEYTNASGAYALAMVMVPVPQETLLLL